MPQSLRDIYLTLSSNGILIVIPLIRIVLYVIFGYLLLKLIDSTLKRLPSLMSPADLMRAPRVPQRTETLRHIIRSFSKVVVLVFLIIMIGREFGFDTST